MQVFEFHTRGHFKYQYECQNSALGDLIWLVAEADNEYDEYAIRVINSNGKMLGYVPSEYNQEIYNLLVDKCFSYCGIISNIEINDLNETMPWITLHLSKTKIDLPFKQEEKFVFAKNSESKNELNIKNKESENNEDDSKNLFFGILFIVALICIAKLISMI
jgi:hypothetical protein